jgi:hypothetical protein
MTKPITSDQLQKTVVNMNPADKWRIIKKLGRHKNIKIEEFDIGWKVGIVGDTSAWVIAKPRTCDKCKHNGTIVTHKPCRRCIWKDEHPNFEEMT